MSFSLEESKILIEDRIERIKEIDYQINHDLPKLKERFEKEIKNLLNKRTLS